MKVAGLKTGVWNSLQDRACMRQGDKSSCGIVAVALCAMLSTGCFWTSKSEGDQLKKRVSSLESGLLEERKKLADQLVEAQDKINRLEDLLDRATRVLAKNNTDIELRVQQLEEQGDTVRGSLSEMQNTVNVLQKSWEDNQKLLNAGGDKSGMEQPLDSAQIPVDKKGHFDAARTAYEAGEYAKARSLDREYIQRYSKDAHADDAQYWIGAGYLQQKKPATALGEFRKVIATYPKSDVLDKTLFDMAEAFWQLQACTDAKSALTALIEGHKKSSLRVAAQQKLKKIKQARRGYCTS